MKRNLVAYIALLPMAVVVIFAYLGTMAWSVRLSFSSSKLLPRNDFVGLNQHLTLFDTSRWLTSLGNLGDLVAFFFLLICFVLGCLLAIFIDQKVRGESLFRTIFLYPYAMSFVVTGLIWQWILNPDLGIQHTQCKASASPASCSTGWSTRRWCSMPSSSRRSARLRLGHGFDPRRIAVVDTEIWRATRIDGIPTWRVYVSIVLPMLRPMIITSLVLLSISIVKMYDVVVAMTNGGLGTASEGARAKFIMDNLFERANIGLATAASTVMLVTVLLVMAPVIYGQYFRKSGRAS